MCKVVCVGRRARCVVSRLVREPSDCPMAIFAGLFSDLRKPNTPYFDDYFGPNVWNFKVLASVLFMFATSIFPAITFASLLHRETNSSIGVIEVLLSSCITGSLYSIFSGQPVTIVGVTGPTSILTIATYNMSKRWNIDFIPFYGCAQLWAFVLHLLLVMFNSCQLAKYITDFSCEIFGILIALIYFESGIDDLVIGFKTDVTIGLFEFILAVGLFLSCKIFSEAKMWHIFNDHIRELIADYGPTISVIVWTYIGNSNRHNQNFVVRRLEVPKTFSTTTDRPWLVDLSVLPAWAIFAAILPGFIITVLFFFDHNISSLMAQPKYYHLKKPNTFHWDFLVVGFGLLLTGLLGIPPTCGLIPQSPLHSKSLVTYATSTEENSHSLQHVHHQQVVKVYEQRVSNLSQSVLMGIMCSEPLLRVLHLIPQSLLDGFFLYLGFASFYHNEVAQRLFLISSEKKFHNYYRNYSPLHHDSPPDTMSVEEGGKEMDRDSPQGDPASPSTLAPPAQAGPSSTSTSTTIIPFSSIVGYTAIQSVCVIAIFVIVQTPSEIIFPLLIGVLVPIRMYLLPRYFSAYELSLLDHNHVVDHYPPATDEISVDEGHQECLEVIDDPGAVTVLELSPGGASVSVHPSDYHTLSSSTN
jgi:boron transporter